jgi:hypothetical protein
MLNRFLVEKHHRLRVQDHHHRQDYTNLIDRRVLGNNDEQHQKFRLKMSLPLTIGRRYSACVILSNEIF